MPDSGKNLGKLVAVYGIAPAYLQRAVFIVILSFLFFLAMMFVYYIRQNILYFLLASAFLLLYLVTMFSFVMQRRNVIKMHENGIEYKGRPVYWSEIESVNEDGTIAIRGGAPIIIPKAIHDVAKLIGTIRERKNF